MPHDGKTIDTAKCYTCPFVMWGCCHDDECLALDETERGKHFFNPRANKPPEWCPLREGAITVRLINQARDDGER